MNVKEIETLALVMQQAQLSSLEVTEGNFTLKLTRETPVVVSARSPLPEELDDPRNPVLDGQDKGLDFNEMKAVVSPMVGVFYRSPAPGAEPFVKPGAYVKKGDVLCIIEAMKLMNEILADEDCQVVDVLASDGDVVEYGQTLFKTVKE
jgi:acetyl-CoA carboxylase biotin carboxyl carrier protein